MMFCELLLKLFPRFLSIIRNYVQDHLLLFVQLRIINFPILFLINTFEFTFETKFSENQEKI